MFNPSLKQYHLMLEALGMNYRESVFKNSFAVSSKDGNWENLVINGFASVEYDDGIECFVYRVSRAGIDYVKKRYKFEKPLKTPRNILRRIQKLNTLINQVNEVEKDISTMIRTEDMNPSIFYGYSTFDGVSTDVLDRVKNNRYDRQSIQQALDEFSATWESIQEKILEKEVADNEQHT